jgi:DNA-binding CsgD family transcriptional regulator
MTLDELDEAWQVLNHREKVVLKQRFGLNGDQPQTRKQIGIELGISPQNVRNIEGKAFFKLRRAKPKPVKRRPRKPKYVEPPLVPHTETERLDWMEEAIKHQSLYIDWSDVFHWTLRVKRFQVKERSLRDLLDRAMMQ